MHDWVNIDRDTVGWYRCSRCGCRHNVGKGPAPRPEDRINYRARELSCTEIIAAKAAQMGTKLAALLHAHDSDTGPIRAALAASLTK